MTIRDIRENIKKELACLYPEREITGIIHILFEHRLNLQRHEVGLRADREPGPDDILWFDEALEKLRAGLPVHHITGEADFYGFKLNVSPEVLVPRPETEELVDWILSSDHHAGPEKNGKLRILDIGTGSGCIAIALARTLDKSDIYATDISDSALAIAGENARLRGCRIEFLRHDILSAAAEIPGKVNAPHGTGRQNSELPGKAVHSSYDQAGTGLRELDIIVSNPPYIPSGERDGLNANVKDHEPETALFVPDEDPLFFYRHICKFARGALRSGGYLYVEIHEQFGMETLRLFRDHGFSDILLRKDINRKDRMVRGKKA